MEMNRTLRNIVILIIIAAPVLFGCNRGQVKESVELVPVDSLTPVSVVRISNDPLTEYIELNAVSAFLQKFYVKANTNGYLQTVDAYLGKYVQDGQLLFKLKTKEAQSIGNSINGLDSSLKFSGIIDIRSSGHGFITQLNHQSGDYVQDGEQLAAISDMNSFVFLLDLPYELRPDVIGKSDVEVDLPDGEKLHGIIASALPTVDANSQTQSLVVKVNTSHSIPENLIAKVRIIKSKKMKTISLPKSAILTNETQDEFWVMKMIDSTTAIRVPVKKGIEMADRVEVISPKISDSDRVLVSGNYGLPDTARVRVIP
jgi:multidrug efflux pump subunit AcrA (membrane-fusion protein)